MNVRRPRRHGSSPGDVIEGAMHRFLAGEPALLYTRLFRGLLTLVLLVVFGIVGYMLIEGWSVMDALFMTVISISTVGYQEVQPLSTGGRVFTIFVILFGVGTALYILSVLVRSVVEGELATAFGVGRMKSRIDTLAEHYILCGYGRVGQQIAIEFEHRDVPFVIIESDERAVDRCLEANRLVIEGDATHDEVLRRAGVERARCLVAASDSDAGNTYITLAAKALRPDLSVVARIGLPADEPLALRAGADRVISPYALAGRRMAVAALQPMAIDFIDLLAPGIAGGQLLAELVVRDDSEINGLSVKQAIDRTASTTLLAVQQSGGALLVSPPTSYVLQAGDRLMLITNEPDMEALGRANSGPPPPAGSSPGASAN